jgi:AcrR family transcriptional regulator
VVLDAVRDCVAEWGWAKVTVEDVCARAGVSRATVYRLFPGGRDVLFEALRVREIQELLDHLAAEVSGADTLEDLLVGTIVAASVALRDDTHLAAMMAAEPGETLGSLTVAGVPRIVSMTARFFAPLAMRFVDRALAEELAEVLTRLVISHYLAPSTRLDFTDGDSTRRFVRTYIPAVTVATGPEKARNT